MFILTFTRKLYKALSSDSSPEAIAFAVAFGALAGCVPVTSGLAMFMMGLVLVFRVQLASALLAWGLFRAASYAGLALAYERIGEAVLEGEAMRSFWTWFFNLPLIPWLDLHYHAIFGGAVVGFGFGFLLWFPIRMMVVAYRRWVHEKLSENRFFKWLTNFWVIKMLKYVFVG